MKKLLGSTLAILFLIGLNSYKASAGRIPPVPVLITEQDGDPLSILRRMVYPNGTLVNTGGGVIEINVGSAGDISALSASTAAIQIQLDDNDALTGTLGISTATNASGIAANLIVIDILGTSTAANAANVATNASDISANLGTIGTLSASTFSNAGNIATNASDIADNASEIAALSLSTAGFQSQIDANSDLLGVMGTSTDTLQGLIDTNIADILGLGTSTGTIDASLTAHINATAVHGATPSNLADRIVLRDISGNFSAGTITAALVGNVTGNLTGNADTATTATTASDLVAGSAVVSDLEVADDITLTNITQITNRSHTNLTDIGTNSHDSIDTHIAATTAHGADATNAINRIVLRDGSGNFSAGIITAALTGAASLNVLKTGDTMTGQLTLPLESDATNPTLAFGDGDTGFYENVDDKVRFASLGIDRLEFDVNGIQGLGSGSFFLLNEQASATNPTLTPNRTDNNTGIGQAAAGALSLIASGVEGIRVTNSAGDIITIMTGSVGIGVDPTEALDVLGNGLFSGDVTATNFIGDGSALTGIGGVFVSTASSKANEINISSNVPIVILSTGAVMTASSATLTCLATINNQDAIAEYTIEITEDGSVISEAFDMDLAQFRVNQIEVIHVYTPTAGAHTYACRIATDSGGGGNEIVRARIMTIDQR